MMSDVFNHAILNGGTKLFEVGICLVLAIPVAIVWGWIYARKIDKDKENPIKR